MCKLKQEFNIVQPFWVFFHIVAKHFVAFFTLKCFVGLWCHGGANALDKIRDRILFGKDKQKNVSVPDFHHARKMLQLQRKSNKNKKFKSCKKSTLPCPQMPKPSSADLICQLHQ